MAVYEVILACINLNISADITKSDIGPVGTNFNYIHSDAAVPSSVAYRSPSRTRSQRKFLPREEKPLDVFTSTGRFFLWSHNSRLVHSSFAMFLFLQLEMCEGWRIHEVEFVLFRFPIIYQWVFEVGWVFVASWYIRSCRRDEMFS